MASASKRSSEGGEPSAKRAKPVDYDWRVVIANPQPFRDMVDIQEKVLTDAHFTLHVSDNPAKLTGIKAEDLSADQVCCLRATFECPVELGRIESVKGEEFCCDLKAMAKILEQVDPTSSIEFLQMSNTTDVNIKVRDANGSITMDFQLTTKDSKSQEYPFDNMQYDQHVVIDMSKLKNICKHADSVGSDTLRIRLQERRESASVPNDAPEDSDEKVQTLITLSVDGEHVNSNFYFRSSTEQQCDSSGRVYVRASSIEHSMTADDGDLKTVYDQKFVVKYLNDVMRKMDRMAYLSLGTNMPLVIQYPLGHGASEVRVVIAAKDE